MLKTSEIIRIQFAKSDEVVLVGEQYPYIEIAMHDVEPRIFLYESSTGHSHSTLTSALETVSYKYPVLRIKGIETKLFTKLT